MRVQLLVVEGCPNRLSTLELVRDVMLDLGLDPWIEEISVRDAAEAGRLAFPGSPTVRVNGLDVESARSEDAVYGLSCRLYGSARIPSREMIAAALRNGVEP